MMEKWLTRLALWIWAHYNLPIPHRTVVPDNCFTIPKEVAALIPQIRNICIEAQQHHAMSGEWKRHRVYAAAIKLAPLARRRDLSLAIELSLPEES